MCKYCGCDLELSGSPDSLHRVNQIHFLHFRTRSWRRWRIIANFGKTFDNNSLVLKMISCTFSGRGALSIASIFSGKSHIPSTSTPCSQYSTTFSRKRHT